MRWLATFYGFTFALNAGVLAFLLGDLVWLLLLLLSLGFLGGLEAEAFASHRGSSERLGYGDR
ncbi:hypothetical protein CAI21_22165 [Alkalilimnicola ehrlichii]|uniref:Uncharacterized protein n=1 Tax=Alkalilimnicola ehrlichii TaxID=351052 RepID=A0A3E0WF23_9GAMM|nr:hypothetical protein [Alkalilimnicola ehrlichii]RFA24310.1 hypothetical protein CAI21_22165 [Alkalilimnicola ehrlichii]RFA31552.1 hypothetical protein CAL65_22290 [Alkalilimnicola ehrlichii]